MPSNHNSVPLRSHPGLARSSAPDHALRWRRRKVVCLVPLSGTPDRTPRMDADPAGWRGLHDALTGRTVHSRLDRGANSRQLTGASRSGADRSPTVLGSMLGRPSDRRVAHGATACGVRPPSDARRGHRQVVRLGSRAEQPLAVSHTVPSLPQMRTAESSDMAIPATWPPLRKHRSPPAEGHSAGPRGHHEHRKLSIERVGSRDERASPWSEGSAAGASAPSAPSAAIPNDQRNGADPSSTRRRNSAGTTSAGTLLPLALVHRLGDGLLVTALSYRSRTGPICRVCGR